MTNHCVWRPTHEEQPDATHVVLGAHAGIPPALDALGRGGVAIRQAATHRSALAGEDARARGGLVLTAQPGEHSIDPRIAVT